MQDFGPLMSALGHKRTYAPQKAMSALPPIIDCVFRHVCIGPKADIGRYSFDHFVGAASSLQHAGIHNSA
jgi:hypothetical protein